MIDIMQGNIDDVKTKHSAILAAPQNDDRESTYSQFIKTYEQLV